jgi:hypothetical protein
VQLELKMIEIDALLTLALDDYRHGWSVGTFGAIGEFVRDDAERVERARNGMVQEIVTARGGMRLSPSREIRVIAFDTLSSDGETWNQAVAFCLPKGASDAPQAVHRIGPDTEALRADDRDAILFDMGVAVGLVKMCIRTRDADLIAALDAMEGKLMLGPDGGKAAGLVLKTSPHRVMLSPVARVEVYVAIPAPGGESPLGPHTHMLPKLIASGRTHAANAPIPEGMQPVLMLHPRSPWRDAAGKRTPFDAGLDAYFESLLQQHGLADDRSVRGAVEAAVRDGDDPKLYAWPVSRRGRAQARITLRRLARKMGEDRVALWKTLYDRAPPEDEEPAAA